MRIVRTPEERFENLDRFPHPPNYQNIDDGQGGTLPLI